MSCFDIKQRGLEIAPDLAVGDGALGVSKIERTGCSDLVMRPRNVGFFDQQTTYASRPPPRHGRRGGEGGQLGQAPSLVWLVDAEASRRGQSGGQSGALMGCYGSPAHGARMSVQSWSDVITSEDYH